ncbi:MAG: hypothetical protein ACM3SW_03685, partial [Actinomycetota bacterium]
MAGEVEVVGGIAVIAEIHGFAGTGRSVIAVIGKTNTYRGLARMYAIVNDWDNFVQDPLHSVLSGAGFVWYGGLIGGFLAVSWT